MNLSNLNEIKLTPKQIAIAVIFILAIITALVLRLYFSNKALELFGPNFIASSESIAIIVYNEHLYRLDENGHILQNISFDEIGLKNRVADIQLVNNDKFAVGDWGNERILLCEFEGVLCNSLTKNLDKHLGNFFKFYYRETENDIFIADTDRHRILHYDIETHAVNKVSSKKQLLYPNYIRFENDNRLYVTDTNHHRITRFEFIDDRLKHVGNDFRVPEDISDNKWPVDYVLTDNRDIFILQANNQLQHADLIYLPANGEAKNIPLPAGADISDMQRMQNTLLLTDREQFAIYSMNIIDYSISPFGSERLNNIFKTDREITSKWQTLATAMMVLMVSAITGVVIFIVMLAIKGKPEAPQATSQAIPQSTVELPPITPGKLTWLAPNPTIRSIFLLLVVLLIIITGLFYSVILLLDIDFSSMGDDPLATQLIYLLALMGITYLIIIVNAIHNVFSKIGTDGIYIYVKTLFGMKKATPRNALYNKQYIAKGSLIIAYRNNIQQYFHDKDQFESYITPLLVAYGKETTVFTIMKHTLKHPNKLFFFNSVAIVFCCFIIFDMFRKGYMFN